MAMFWACNAIRREEVPTLPSCANPMDRERLGGSPWEKGVGTRHRTNDNNCTHEVMTSQLTVLPQYVYLKVAKKMELLSLRKIFVTILAYECC